MEDLNHYFSADLSASGTGDLSVAKGLMVSQQRIIRMVCTPEDDYTFEPGWGIGAGKYIGQPANRLGDLSLNILSRLVQDGYAVPNPPPEVDVRTNNTALFCDIKYVDPGTNEEVFLTFQVK